MGDYVAKSLIQTLHTFSQMVTQFLPRLLAMVIIVVVGWVVAWLVKVILPRILSLVRFNSLFVRAGVTQVLTKAALPTPSEMLARLGLLGPLDHLHSLRARGASDSGFAGGDLGIVPGPSPDLRSFGHPFRRGIDREFRFACHPARRR